MNNQPQDTWEKVGEQLYDCWTSMALLPLQESTLPQSLMELTDAWAAGVWKIENGYLQQVLFVHHPEFDSEVAAEFQSATLQVPLDQTELGIVNALVNQRPVRALAAEQGGELKKSAGWLDRFGAGCSWSCPVINAAGEPQGVIAVSWRKVHEEQDPPCLQLLALTEYLSQRLSNQSADEEE